MKKKSFAKDGLPISKLHPLQLLVVILNYLFSLGLIIYGLFKLIQAIIYLPSDTSLLLGIFTYPVVVPIICGIIILVIHHNWVKKKEWTWAAS